MADIYLNGQIPAHLHEFFEPAEIGLEPTPDAYVAKLVEVFREVRRVMRDDATLWLNLGDSYGGGGDTFIRGRAGEPSKNPEATKADQTAKAIKAAGLGKANTGLPAKNLLGIPWRVAFALQADGWWLRQDIVWSKPNPMPESVLDRCTKSHEYIFLLAKSATYFYDHEAVRESVADSSLARWNGGTERVNASKQGLAVEQGSGANSCGVDPAGRNKRSVWTVASEPYSGAHFATFPRKLIEPCILAGAPVGGVVLDPFLGSGTCAQVAQDLGRQWIGCELNRAYEQMQRERVAQTSFLLEAA